MINVFQVFITDNNSPLPDLFKESTRTVKENLKNSNYHLFNHEECKDIIRDNFPKEVFNSFLKLNPYAYKHDLAHYCLGFLKGGWLVDISIKKIVEQVMRFPKFLLSLIAILLLTALTFLLSVILILLILVMYVKDLVLGLIHLLWTPIFKMLERARKQ